MLVSRFHSSLWGLCAVLVVVGLIPWTGCSSGGYSGPTGEVSGTVTLNGAPVPQGCTVAFISDKGFTASGQVGADGKYELSVIGTGGAKSNSVPAATYAVSVTAPGTAGQSEADYDAMMEAESAGDAGAVEDKPADGTIPAKYQSAGTSGLSFEVKEGSNTIDITLE